MYEQFGNKIQIMSNTNDGYRKQFKFFFVFSPNCNIYTISTIADNTDITHNKIFFKTSFLDLEIIIYISLTTSTKVNSFLPTVQLLRHV